jgi:hypothetical protein
MSNKHDVTVLRELAKKYKEIAHKDIQEERRELWRKHNSFVHTRPLVYVREFLSIPELIEPQLECEKEEYRELETLLRYWIQHDSFNDDYIIEPWIVVPAVYQVPLNKLWGVEVQHQESEVDRGAWKFDPPIKELADKEKLIFPHHRIDEGATKRKLNLFQDAIGDIVSVTVSRAPVYNPNLAEYLADLRGLEQLFWDMHDNKAWLHELIGFLQRGVLTAHEEAEEAGDWHFFDGTNQAMTYSLELPDPSPNNENAVRKDLWCFCNAQELTLVSPDMHDEFMIRYQLPLMKHFGLIAYGCCEDLSNKIDILRKIPNLRRIAVTPFADIRKCAEEIGTDYIISWRPSPAEMVSNKVDPDYIRMVIKDADEVFSDLHYDICLKDVVTVRGEPERIKKWVSIVRSTIE